MEGEEKNLKGAYFNESNGCTPEMKENSLLLLPVGPCDTGEGLPYAPVNWPNPGDIWSWRVGRRINSYGYYTDRFLYPPRSILNLNVKIEGSGKTQFFASKASIERFFQKEFPDVDVVAFFASFTWKIPAKGKFHIKSKSHSDDSEYTPQVGSENAEIEAVEEEAPKTIHSQRKRKKRAGRKPTKKYIVTDSNSEADQVATQNMDQSFSAPQTPPESSTNMVIEGDFDKYLKSLEDILTPPQPQSDNPQLSASDNSNDISLEEITESRKKLSSLLVMDFPSLVSSEFLPELTILASKLRKDPSLSADQLINLKLIEEIPLFSKAFIENRKTIQKTAEFFSDLDLKKAKVTSLKGEYTEMKEESSKLQTKIDSDSVLIQEIDNQIAQLQSQRADLSRTIESQMKTNMGLISAQKTVANSIPALVNEIQLAFSEKHKWEMTQRTAAQREAEILAKFAPLKGYTL